MEKNTDKLKNCFNKILERGYYYQSTGKEDVEKLLTTEPTTIYMGIDPTADSLHIGHCFPFFMLKYLQEAGHKIIVLLGGATAMVGDPSGKTDMRQMVTKEFIDSNYNKIKGIISKFLDAEGDNPFVLVNNADWYKGYDYVNFMREIALHFNVNKMLATDAYSRRLEQGGLTFFEMGYMLMQAYDFVHLNRSMNCKLQVGGSDQWANILAGVELGRKLNNLEGKSEKEYQALTIPLLTNSEGKKMGKTEKGALWVAEEKTSAYDFYQYFYNVADTDVEKLFKQMTRLSLEEIQQLLAGDIRVAKQRMAFEITKVVHGQEKAEDAVEIAKNLFTSGSSDNAPTKQIESSILPIDFASLCTMVELTKSNGEARKLVSQNGLSINGEAVKAFDMQVSKEDFEEGFVMLKRGKKNFVKVELK